MNRTAVVEPRQQTFGEELANSLSHGVGFVATIVASIFLIVFTVKRGDALAITGAAVFAGATMMVYLSSTVYHALPYNRAKKIARAIDHISIYIMIAGTYTPFTLGVMRGGWGWTMFGLVWGLALTGIVFTLMGRLVNSNVATGLYLLMGWLVVIAAKPVYLSVPTWGLVWILLGGVAYTTGVGFYVADRRPYYHFIWHLWVLAGTACHFVAVSWYAS